MTCVICVTTIAVVASLTRSEAKQATTMWTQLQYIRHSSGAFLSALLLLTSGQTTSFEQLFSTDPNNATVTPLCDEAQLRNVAQQVAQLKISSENIFLLLESYNLRLDYIKMLLDERLPEVRTKSHWIDVRGGAGGSGESISSTDASTGGVLFPSLSTQFSASSQSSASDVDLPVISTQSSAVGVNIPATDVASFVGGAYLPVIGTKPSESVADISSSTTDSSLPCGCNSQILF